MSNTNNPAQNTPRPKRTAQPDLGAKYEVAVATLVAASLSINEHVENYHVFTNLKEALPFDDVVAKVFFKGEIVPYAFALQLKHLGKGETIDVEKYLKGYNKILDAGGFQTIENIAVDNIHFCYFCIENVRTKEGYKLHAHNPIGESWRSTLSIQNSHKLSYTKTISDTDKTRKDFLDKFYLYLNQPYGKVEEKIKILCKVTDTTDILKYVDRFFDKDVLWRRGLSKEVFEAEVLKNRISDYIVSPTDIIPLDNSQCAAWNKLTLHYKVTIVEADTNIEKSLYGCLAQMLNYLLNNAVEWKTCKANGLGATVIEEFKKLFATGDPVRVRHWIDVPSTLKSLITELWKSGEVPLILKTEEELSALKDYVHLNKSYIVITDNLVNRRAELQRHNLRAFTHLSDIECFEVRDELLQKISISLHGRKPITLYSIVSHHEELAGTLSCLHILRLIKSREVYLDKKYVEDINNMIFLIENPTISDSIDTISKGENNFLIRCRPDVIYNYRNQIEEHPKLQSYPICHCAVSSKNENLTLVEGNRLPLRDFFVDQDGESVYYLEDTPIPILGSNLGSIQQNYFPRFLRTAVISKSIFHSRTKGIFIFSGDFNYLEANVRKQLIEVPEENIRFKDENVFIDVRYKDVGKYWNKASALKCPLLHIRVAKAGMQLWKCKAWRGITDYISYGGSEISEENLLTEITSGITVLTGEPGIGKSCLLRSLFKDHGTGDYVLFYNLTDYKVQKSNELLPNDFSLNFIINKFKGTLYSEFVTNLYKTKEGLLVLLDSFDEVLPHHKEKTLNFIRNLITSNVKIIIASRLLANHILMDNFETRIFKVDLLKPDDRRECIKNCKLAEEDLTTLPIEFTGNPLYLNFLKTISENNVTMTHISRLTLFENIMHIKLNQYFERNFSSDCDLSDKEYLLAPILELHCKLALVRILGAAVVEKWLKWKYEEKLPNKLKLGVILSIDEDGYPTFIHETFAEFLTANWMTRKIGKDYTRDIYLEILEQKKLYVLDILCEHLELHKAVINMNLEHISMYASERSHLEKAVALGRTALHVAAAYFRPGTDRYFFLLYSPIDIIIYNMCELKINFTASDGLMQWDWIQHLNGGSLINLMPCYDLSTSVIESYVNGILETLSAGNKILHIGDSLADQIRQTYREALEACSIDLIRNLCFLEDATLNGISQALVHKKCQILEADILKKIRAFTPLHVACISGNMHAVRELIELKHDVNSTDDFGCTPLYYSIINQPEIRMDMTKMLLENGSKIDIANSRGETPLSIAVRSGHVDIAELLLQKGVCSNAMQTLLFLALEKRDPDMAELLFKFKADVNCVNEDGESALQFVIDSRKCDFALAKLLLHKGANVNYAHYDGRTALMVAAEKGNLDGVALLLEHSADVKSTTSLGVTPLMFASRAGQVQRLFLRPRKGANFNSRIVETSLLHTSEYAYSDVIEKLLDKGADINSTTPKGETPLIFATERGNLDIVKLLLKKGANIDGPTTQGKTPLILAIDFGHSDVVKLLLQKGANINSATTEGKTPLILAIDFDRSDIVKLLLEKDANINSTTLEGKTPLMFATERDNFDIVQLLLQKAANINSATLKGKTPLMFAAERGNIGIVQLLLKEGANINSAAADGKTPLILASDFGHSDVVRLLVERGANINGTTTNDETPLMFAVRRYNCDVVRLLLENGALVNSTTSDGKTPLMFAARWGKSDIVQLLLQNGATVDSITDASETPLMFAVKQGNSDIVQLLLKEGADVNSFRSNGETPLLYAFQRKQSDIIKLLLEKGANVHSTTKNGETPLTFAVRWSLSDIVKSILEKGADINSTTIYGETTLMSAIRLGNPDIMKLLLEKGATASSTTYSEMSLISAVLWDDLDAIKLLLERFVGVNSTAAFSETLLLSVAKRGNPDVVKLLLEKEANANSRKKYGEKLLLYAVEQGNSDIVRLLLEKEIDVNSRVACGQMLLLSAIERNNLDIIKLLLERGTNVNSTTKSSQQLLVAAYAWGNSKVVKLLLEKCGNFNSGASYSKALLLSVIKLGQTDIANLLLEKGANVNSKAGFGKTPLITAVRCGNPHMVKLLLEKGAHVNSRTLNGETPLLYACQEGNSDVIKILLERGANTNRILRMLQSTPEYI